MRPKDYIEAVYARIQAGDTCDEVLARLRALLSRKGRNRLYPRIVKGLAEKLAKSEKSIGSQVILARESDASVYREDITASFGKLGTADVSFSTRIDETLVGGFITTGNGRRIDRSYKSMLLDAYHKVVQ